MNKEILFATLQLQWLELTDIGNLCTQVTSTVKQVTHPDDILSSLKFVASRECQVLRVELPGLLGLSGHYDFSVYPKWHCPYLLVFMWVCSTVMYLMIIKCCCIEPDLNKGQPAAFSPTPLVPHVTCDKLLFLVKALRSRAAWLVYSVLFFLGIEVVVFFLLGKKVYYRAISSVLSFSVFKYSHSLFTIYQSARYTWTPQK